MDTNTKKCYNWIDAKIAIGTTDSISVHIVYNHIINKQINGDNYKFLFFDVDTGDSSDSKKYKKLAIEYRESYAKHLKNTIYQHSFNTNNGISSMIDAINCSHENLICLYKNKKLIGALSYTIGRQSKNISIDHLGVTEKCKGYGRLLISELFKLFKEFNYSITATTNGYSDGFYKKMGMRCISRKPIPIYQILSKQLKELII